MKRLGLLFVMAALAVVAGLSACSGGSTETLTVASETRQCYGVGIQECMLVKSAGDETWSFFYGNIEGFDYEPGYEYVLKVRKEEVKNPPQDASSVKYVLVRIVSKVEKTSEGLPAEI